MSVASDKGWVPLHRRPIVDHINAALAFYRGHRRRLRTIGLAIALVVFAAGLVWSLRELSGISAHFRIVPCVILVLLLLPLGLAINAAGFKIMAKMAGAEIGWGACLQTIIFARAANFLPIPAGFVTRVAALRAGGAPLGLASYLTILTTGLWGALAFGFAGFWVADRQQIMAIAFGVLCLVGLSICAIGFAVLKIRPSLIVMAVLLRCVGLVQETLSILAAFHAIGTAATFSQSALLVVSTFVGTAMSIFPDGLGIREALAMLLVPLVNLDPATGFIATSLLRGLGLGVLLVGAGVAYLTTKGSET